MKKLMIVILAGLVYLPSTGQTFKVAKSSGRLEIHLGKVSIEGYKGNEIVFSSMDSKSDNDERAKGLKAINGLGLEDNTGLGINVKEEGNLIVAHQLKRTSPPHIKIQVPKGVIVSFQHDSQYGGTVSFKNMENEIEVSAQYNSIEMENVTGPMIVKSIYGHVEADFKGAIKNPISIVSVYGYVDVSIPSSTNANLQLDTSYGEIFVARDFKLEVTPQENMIKYNDRVRGKLNGGGTLNIDLSSNYGKIYLRKSN